MLCYFEGVTDWTQYSQARIVPTDISGILFANAGPFREHLSPVHGYDRFSFASRHGEFDVSDVSAGGGWTGGNVIMSPRSAAEWIFALYGTLTLFATSFPTHLAESLCNRPRRASSIKQVCSSNGTASWNSWKRVLRARHHEPHRIVWWWEREPTGLVVLWAYG